MRISDWSSDVCSSDLQQAAQDGGAVVAEQRPGQHELLEVTVQVVEMGRPIFGANRTVAGFIDAVEGEVHRGSSWTRRVVLRAIVLLPAGGRRGRSAERRVGKGWGGTGRSRW